MSIEKFKIGPYAYNILIVCLIKLKSGVLLFFDMQIQKLKSRKLYS